MTPSLLLLPLAAYLIGSLSGSLLLGKLRGVDIRTQGSGNAGGTNAFRTQGAKFALGVLLIDVCKGMFATWLAFVYAPHALGGDLPYVCAFAAVVGHIWPVWHGFRGGKGAATAMGAIAMLWPITLPGLLVLWICSVILTGYVGFSTCLTGLGFAAAALYVGGNDARTLFAIAIAALIVFTHRANLMRMRAGTESRFEKAMLLSRRKRRHGA
ncbi:MAG: glycerol-3-phosphate 1-O-acyltransferase PlsY [Lysobacter sp.]|nr:glycerol-3-phosphate 1-O-acyltransferase PlsY [Lysobacter sp.]